MIPMLTNEVYLFLNKSASVWKKIIKFQIIFFFLWKFDEKQCIIENRKLDHHE